MCCAVGNICFSEMRLLLSSVCIQGAVAAGARSLSVVCHKCGCCRLSRTSVYGRLSGASVCRRRGGVLFLLIQEATHSFSVSAATVELVLKLFPTVSFRAF